MATSSQFAATPNIGSAVLSATANAASTAGTPTASSTATIATAGASGTKIEELVFIGTGVTVAGLVQVFLFDSSAYHFYDALVIPVVTPSTTQAPFRQVNGYSNLELKSGWTLVCCSTVASQLINVVASGGDL